MPVTDAIGANDVGAERDMRVRRGVDAAPLPRLLAPLLTRQFTFEGVSYARDALMNRAFWQRANAVDYTAAQTAVRRQLAAALRRGGARLPLAWPELPPEVWRRLPASLYARVRDLCGGEPCAVVLSALPVQELKARVGARTLYALGMALDALQGAMQAPVPAAQAAAWAQEIDRLLRHPASGAIRRDDLRFGALVLAIEPHAATLGEALHALAQRAPYAQGEHVPALATLAATLRELPQRTLAEEVRSCAEALARRQPDFFASARNTSFLAERMGVLGEDAHTLEAIGRRYGVTRERVRQVVDRLLSGAPQRSFYCPALTRLRQALPPLLPQSETALNNHFVAHLGEQLSVLGAARFAGEALGKPLALERLQMPLLPPRTRGRVLVRDAVDAWVRKLPRQAARLTNAVGAGQVGWLAARLQTEGVEAATPERVGALLQCLEDFAWLDRATGWFWLGEAYSTALQGQLKRMLAVATGRLDAREAHEGWLRSRQYVPGLGDSGLTLPLPLLAGLCRGLSWLRLVQSNDIEATVQLSPATELGAGEFALYEALLQLDGIATPGELRALPRLAAMSHINLAMLLARSAVLQRLGFGLYALRGHALSAVALSRAQVSLREAVTPIAVEFAGPSTVTWTLTLTAGSLNNRAHVLPARAQASVPDGMYRLNANETLRVHAGSRVTGIATYAKRRDWPAGSLIQVSVDPAAGSAELELLDEGDAGAEGTVLPTVSLPLPSGNYPIS